jgi:hypothetical protein
MSLEDGTFEKVDLSVLPPSLIVWARRQAQIQGVTLDDIINEALSQFLDKHEAKQ